ncbi:Zinc finger protein 808 [Formica fusca]
METKVKSFNKIEDEKIHTYKICRLCGEKSVRYVPIFEENNYCIPEKISRCLPIIISPTDNLPSNICRRCLCHLNTSYRLILTSMEIDDRLRTQLDQKQKNIFKDQYDVMSCEESEISKSTNAKLLLLRELKKRAIAGPTECDLCDLNFQDVDAFDTHMEQSHFLKWRCNLCDSSFYQSNELITHKTLRHSGNIVICSSCEHVNDQEDKWKITNERNIHNQDKQQKIDKNNDSKEAVATFTVNEEIATSLINIAVQTDDDIIEIETESSPVQIDSAEQSDTNSDSDTDRIIKNCNILLKKLKMFNKHKEKERSFCDICKIYFGEDRYFEAHNKIHEEKSVTCTICCTECSSIYELFLHKRAMHDMYKKIQLRYVCNKCNKFFTNSWHWENHNENNCSKMANKYCKYCNTTFATHLKLTRHLRKHKWEMINDPTVTIYKCVACPKIFVDKELYEKHRNVHDPECWDKFKCTICDRPFSDKSRLRKHLTIHENNKLHQCDICGRRFLHLHNMTMHRKIHFGHKCSYCDTVFKKRQDLIKHIQESHGLEPDVQKLSSKLYMSKIYICRFCGKKLSTYQSLINHERIHTGEMPFSCPICHRSFRSYTSRWTHIQRHQKGNFMCEHCGKCFSYKQNLTMHMQTHLPMEARKYQCNICEKKFMRNSHLSIHKRIHEGIRPFKCDVCSLSFTQKGDMKRHRMRHFKQDIKSNNLQSKREKGQA